MDTTGFRDRFDRVASLLESKRFFFVFGAPKSGTTWLQTALNAHPQIVCSGEGHFGDHLATKLAKILQEYFDQQAIVERNVYEGKGHYQHKRNEDYDFLLKTAILNAFTRVHMSPEKIFVGDKTPANVGYLQLFKRLFPQAKFINIVRDGRDTLVSTFKHVERVVRASGEPKDVDGFLREKTKMYCDRWVRSLEQADTFARQHPGVLHTVRYEDLKSDFGLAFSSVLRFLGADDSQEVLAHCEDASSFKRLSGGREAGQEDPSAFVRKGVVGDWQTQLSPEQLKVFDEVGAKWLARMGYEAKDKVQGL